MIKNFSYIEHLVEINAYIGQVVQFPIPDNFLNIFSDNGIPKWLMIKKGLVIGIPKPENIGSVEIKIRTVDDTLTTYRIDVSIETENPCGEEVTSWLDTYWKDKPTLENKLKAAELIRDLDMELDDEIDTLRVYTYAFGIANRNFEVIDQENCTGQFIVTFRASCKDFDDGLDALDEYLSFGKGFYSKKVRLERGFFKLGNSTRKPLVTTKSTTRTMKTTTSSIPSTSITTTTSPIVTPLKMERFRAIDNAKIPNFTCIKGQLCQGQLPLYLFGEEDDSLNLTLTTLILKDINADNWLYFLEKREFSGYPVRSGNFIYYVTKRSESGKILHAPIEVRIVDKPKPNHFVKLDLDRSSCDDILLEPKIRFKFMKHLEGFFGPETPVSLYKIKCNDNVTSVSFSNRLIDSRACDSTETALQDFYSKITQNQSFENHMHHVANVLKLNLILSGPCTEPFPTVNPPVKLSFSGLSPTANVIILLSVLTLIIAIFGVVVMILWVKNRKHALAEQMVRARTQPAVSTLNQRDDGLVSEILKHRQANIYESYV